MNRGNRVLAAILVLQLVVLVVVVWPRTPSTAAGDLLLAGMEADQVASLRIVDPAQGEIELANTGEGWVLAQAGGFPCREGAVPDFLERVLALTTDRAVTETRASHGRLKVAVDDYNRQIDLVLSDGTVRTLYLGTSPSYSVSHVRLAESDIVYLVSGLSTTDASTRATTWIDAVYLTVEGEQVVSMALSNSQGRFEFDKDDAGSWRLADLPAGETLDQGKVTSLLTPLASLRMLEPLGTVEQPSYGLEDPSAVLTVTTRDEDGASQEQVLHIGARDDESQSYVVKASTSDYYVRVSQYSVGELVDKTLEGLIEAPPTPTAAP